jgi:hypothetical protein
VAAMAVGFLILCLFFGSGSTYVGWCVLFVELIFPDG